MRRFRIPEIALGFLLATAFWVVVLWFITDPQTYHQICEPDQYGHEHCAARSPLYVVWWYSSYLINAGTITAIATAAIAFFTLTLKQSTDRLWEAGERQIKTSRKVAATQARQIRISNREARRTADAAERSARSAIALQLPIIRCFPDKLGHGQMADGSEHCSVYTVSISNGGTQNAFPKEILYGWTLGGRLPNEPRYQYLDRFELNAILKPTGSASVQRLSGVYILKPGEWAEICGGNCLWFYCSVMYDDFMGEGRSHAFCWRWSNTGMGMGWRAEDHPAYNEKT